MAEAREQEPGKVVEPANYNSPEQTVIAGHAPAVDRAIAFLQATQLPDGSWQGSRYQTAVD